jgi:hypothetical protein
MVPPPTDGNPAIPHGESFQMELIERSHGSAWLMGGNCTAYIRRVVQSMSTTDMASLKSYPPPPKSIYRWLSNLCFKAVKKVEKERIASQQLFRTRVYNQMMFHRFPTSWLPDIDNISK